MFEWSAVAAGAASGIVVLGTVSSDFTPSSYRSASSAPPVLVTFWRVSSKSSYSSDSNVLGRSQFTNVKGGRKSTTGTVILRVAELLSGHKALRAELGTPVHSFL